MALNHVSIQGRVCADIELRYTQSQKPVASFAVAVDRDFSNQSGEREADFIDVIAWNNTAVFAEKYFRKGSMIVVAGRLQTRTYTDRDGNKRKATEIVASNIYFGDSKKNESAQSEPARRSVNDIAERYPQATRFADLDDDGDLPFN